MKRVLTILGAFLLITHATSVAQKQLSVDQLYEKARIAAFDEGDYKKARGYAYSALDRSPNYHGIRIFVGRLFSWEGKYQKAREELTYVLENDPDNREALLAIIDVENWSGNQRKAMQIVNRAINYYPEDNELLLQKASIFYKLEKYEESEEVYKKILRSSSANREAREGLQEVQLKQMKYKVNVSYRYDYFTDIFDPWKFSEFGLTRQTPYGSIIGRIQYAQRFGSDGTQFNLDAYPSITEGLYAYISGGYSKSSIYPEYRFGISLYKSLPSSFELEIGMRYLDFNTSQTDIYTASLTKYSGSYLFTLRTYLVPSQARSSKSLSLIVRRYFGSANSYLSLNGGFGSASTTTDIQFPQDIQTLDSWSLGIDGQYPLSERLFIGGNAGYDSSEYPNFTRKRFSFKAFVAYRF
ncbi:YaiO family outer membrane beta-barrel protein [Fodinibius salinus]|nr:YaiO family outer membrane beta-barrel protein [Fodinibius salinus]